MRYCVLAVLLLAGLVHAAAKVPSRDDQAWAIFRPAMLEFQDTGDRAKFLATCKQLQAQFPGSRYEQELTTLIAPLEAEAVAPPPPYLAKPPAVHTPEETIQYWVYQLREVGGRQFSDPGYPLLFNLPGDKTVNPADQLVAIGPPAIPYLIQALDDFTPTRTIAWQRSFYPVYFVLRRQDIAMKCLERIVGCQFYEEGATFRHFYMEAPERRQSVLDNVAAWWKMSAGASQAQMINNQLLLRGRNITLSQYDRIRSLEVLAALQGPEAVIDEIHALLAADTFGLNSPVVEVGNQLDPGAVVRGVMQRFRDGIFRDGDYTMLLRYGDQAVYQQIARRYEATGRLDPGAWSPGEQLQWAAKYGQNWAIPLLARGLLDTKMTGSRQMGKMTRSRNFGTADIAIEEFQRLAGKDFGYQPDSDDTERLAEIAAARDWWEKEGRQALADTIARNHPPLLPIGDLLLSEQEITARVLAITGDDATLRRRTVAVLGETMSYRIQRALLDTLPKEPDPAERLAMLGIIAQHPKAWHLPSLTRVFTDDADTAVRVAAGEIIGRMMVQKSTVLWPLRLETREASLAVAWRLADDPNAPQEVRSTGKAILRYWEG